MPLSTNASYIPCLNEFLAHWGQVDAVLTPDLVLPGPDQTPVLLATLTGLRDTLQLQFQEVIDFLNDQEIARGTIELQKIQLLARFNEFNAMLDGYWAGTAFIKARAYAPSLSDGEKTFLSPMRDVLSLWGKLNAAPAPAGAVLPLALSDGSDVADFGTAIAELQAAYVTEAKAKQDVLLARAQRDITKATVKAILITYRKVVPARCARFLALVETLPAVTPPEGHTPKAVKADAVFVAPDQAKVSYEASDEATLARYELRGNPGPDFEEDDAIAIAMNGPSDPQEFLTGFGLAQPGAQASFKVYVILTTGNEAGSAPLKVARPVV